MPGMITRCPKCATAFRISENHLKSAQGMVRCGSCLNVFNAKANLEQTTPKEQKVKKPASKDTPKSTADTPTPSPEKKKVKATAKHSNLFETEAKQPSASFEADDDDEAWALALLRDEGELDEKEKPKAPAKSKFVEEPTLTAPQSHNLNEKIENNEGPTPGKSSLDDFDVPINPLLDMGPSEHVQAHATSPPPSQEPTRAASDTLSDSPSAEPEPSAASNSGDKPRRAKKAKPPKEESHPETEPDASDVAPTDELEVEPAPIKPFLPELGDREWPIELEDTGESGSSKKWLWAALSILGALTLFAQIAWLQFHKLNKTEPYRSLYGYACDVVGCRLPDLIDLQAIETTNLVVRSHPTLSNALVMDVIIKNNAAFEQPFPNLALIFTDIDNQPVAARSFSPSEYLGGELAGMTMMPILQPVHIALSLKDPGKSAVGYKIEVSDAK